MYTLPVAVFSQQQQSGVVVTETVWPARPKMFTLWPFTENLCWPLTYFNGTLFCLETQCYVEIQ